MPLLSVTADFEKVVRVLEDISLSLKHAIRILETTFPIQPVAQWNIKPPSEEIRIVDDSFLLEREDEEARRLAQQGQPPDISLDDLYDLDA